MEDKVVLYIFDSSSDSKTMMSRTYIMTVLGAFMMLVGFILLNSLSSIDIQGASQSITLFGRFLSISLIIIGLSTLIINGARCALYTNEHERQCHEAALEEAENWEEV